MIQNKFKNKKIKNNIKNIQEKRGITLISLVITIVIMIILVAVAMNFILGNNGLIAKTKNSTSIFKISQVQEELQMESENAYTSDVEKSLTKEEIADKMKQDFPSIEWVYKDSLAGKI